MPFFYFFLKHRLSALLQQNPLRLREFSIRSIRSLFIIVDFNDRSFRKDVARGTLVPLDTWLMDQAIV